MQHLPQGKRKRQKEEGKKGTQAGYFFLPFYTIKENPSAL
jgi:hypothetical protein